MGIQPGFQFIKDRFGVALAQGDPFFGRLTTGSLLKLVEKRDAFDGFFGDL